MDNIQFEKEGHIGWLTLNRPQKRNALSLELIQEMKEQIELIAKKEKIRAIIIQGKGPSFCSGHDLKELAGDHDESYYFKIFKTCSDLMQMISHIPQPVIAKVHGAATAAGCQLVASCDLAIASEDAVFATPGVKIGLFCATPMIPLFRLIGPRRALDMLLTGRSVSAKEAKEFGLVNKIVPLGSLDQQARELGAEIANYSRFVVGFGKKTFYQQTDLDVKEAYDYAVNVITQNCMHEDAEEGILARFEKRKPVWKK